MKNWAGNRTYSTENVVAPTTLAELQEIVKGPGPKKVLGSRHSFNAIGDTIGTLISMEHFTEIAEPNAAARTVSVGAGVRYGDLAQFLHPLGWAVHNLASLPHISIVGACATATHGSGRLCGNLATSVVALSTVTGSGEVRHISDESEVKRAAVGLGALGVVTAIALRIKPSFDVAQWVYTDLSFDQVKVHFDDVSRLGYSVSLFTKWIGGRIDQLWVKDRVGGFFDAPETLFGATKSRVKLHPLAEMSPENCTEQLGQPGRWHERLPHFKMEFTPSAGEELQSEFFVPVQHGVHAMEALIAMGERIAPLLYVSEVRFIAADDLLLSPAFQHDMVGLHFTWKPDWSTVQNILPEIETALEPFGAKPHWGKLFTMTGEQVRKVYPGLPEFASYARKMDPEGKFRNDFLNSILGT